MHWQKHRSNKERFRFVQEVRWERDTVSARPLQTKICTTATSWAAYTMASMTTQSWSSIGINNARLTFSYATSVTRK